MMLIHFKHVTVNLWKCRLKWYINVHLSYLLAKSDTQRVFWFERFICRLHLVHFTLIMLHVMQKLLEKRNRLHKKQLVYSEYNYIHSKICCLWRLGVCWYEIVTQLSSHYNVITTPQIRPSQKTQSVIWILYSITWCLWCLQYEYCIYKWWQITKSRQAIQTPPAHQKITSCANVWLVVQLGCFSGLPHDIHVKNRDIVSSIDTWPWISTFRLRTSTSCLSPNHFLCRCW